MLDFLQTDVTDYPLFARLSDGARTCLLERAKLRSYARGETICLQGDAATSLKLVLRGWVKLYRVSTSGNEAVLATLRAGDSFDEAAALQGGVSATSVEAVSDCEVMHIDLGAICACEKCQAGDQPGGAFGRGQPS